MARKKPSSPGDPPPASMTDAAGMLATFAAGVLAQPESRSLAADLKLGRSERAVIAGAPGLDVGLKEQLDIPSTATKSIPFTMDELARICLALSEALLDAEGRDAVKLLKVTGKVTDRLNQAIDEVEQAGKPQRAAPKSQRTTPKSQAAKAAGSVYQLKVTLKDIRPPVWRRLLVPDCSLSMLHEVIQVAMGWENYHLYDFEVGGEHYTDPRGMADLDMEDASRARLGQVAPEAKAKLRYTYDFGDNWQHEVLVEKVVSPEEGMTYPACIDGKRACPPEDLGGPWGYMEFAEAIRDPEHEQHEEFLEWRGEFDPEAFDPDAVNKNLRRLR
ncbi:plasmid pRiA4b ORF-3 family protein [Tautonia plasticadhaerens]|uniref:Plasmid pRiA4b ORF-3-like protein n=1 Tax=Tautonia plasticadhaerens TaxID=2527974 RepID=A0A518H7X9_9BACT|nr:plasmid pRiA4b ORF-3 family protein [Tautonia plasticadhaerens]QDV36967.1 Plasmid pRiA4b ORF-3-like protein [Tautonia plasticadhaerens]